MKKNSPYFATITGIGSHVPQKIVDNQTLYQVVNNFALDQARQSLTLKGHDLTGKSDAEVFDLWVQQVCGIKSRTFISEADSFYSEAVEKKLFVEYLAKEACEQALTISAKHNVTKDDIDQVIFSTYSSNRIMPSAGVTLANILQLPNASAITMNGACSGFLDALIDATIKVQSGAFRHILVVASEQLSDKMNYNDPKTAIIFSDGAGAVIVSRSESINKTPNTPDNQVYGYASGIHYSEQVYMERTGNIFFNSGPLVERNAVRTMRKISERALNHSKLDLSDIDYIVPHQANLRILLSFQKETKFNGQHILKEIETLGNLSSASVPVTLDRFIKSSDQKTTNQPLNFLMVSVGGGYTYSALIASMTPSNLNE